MIDMNFQEAIRKAYTKPKVTKRKIQNNDPCPCNSGLKFKHCHGKQRKGFLVTRYK
jgi:uncharacterized protein YchJ